MTRGVAGKRVALTGGSRGIGRAIAEALLAEGARVALVARSRSGVEALCGQADAAGDAHVVEADLLTCDPRRVIAQAVSALGGIDVLINCAGLVEYAAVFALEEAALARQLRVNFTAPVLLAQAAATHMRAQGAGGDIVSIASTLASSPAPLTAAYAASKAALVSATRSLALELACADIRVNAIAPGVIDTDMVRVPRLRPGETLTPEQERARVAGQLEELRALHLLGRLGSPADVVRAVHYLLASNWVTGTVVTVDGGISLGS